MARLTRTQKYADLRNQLENGRETEIKSEALNKYEDKLNELNINPVITNEEVTPVVEETTQETIIEEPVLEEVVEEVVLETPVVEEVSETETKEEINDDYVPFDFEEVTPIVEEKVEEEVVEEVVEETLDTDEFEAIEVALETPVVEENTQETIIEEPVLEEVVEETREETPVVEEVVQEETTQVSEPLEINVESLIDNTEKEEVIDNKYLEDCLNEVNEYNKSKGLMTADEVPVSILNEIRGTTETVKEEVKEEVVEETPVVEETSLNEENDEDDLSDTVTLEIKKILSELDSDDEEETVETHKVEAQVAPTHDELPKEVSDMLKTYLNEIPEEEPTVEPLEQTMQVTDVSQVKEELVAPKVQKVEETINGALLNETMPLEVASETAINKAIVEDEDEDDDDEKGPNRILNFVLIALIVVLLLVLGFIGYLILVAQGII